jgi:SAM-dependent methyltransferase
MSISSSALRGQAQEADGFYRQTPGGVFVPREAVTHRNEEYDETGFDVLAAMQQRHFWYRGRHRFLLHAVRRALGSARRPARDAIDLGGGCGGWVRYLGEKAPGLIQILALGDSSLRALDFAADVVGPAVVRFQVDLLRLQWHSRWDVVFLLDVLEHIPQDADALLQIRDALRPGGFLFVTTPALRFFWSYNDDLGGHQRRYSQAAFRQLAARAGLELCSCSYFMFFLSPLLYLSRLSRHNVRQMAAQDVRRLVARSHRVPFAPLNFALSSLFALETPVGHWLPFPWGTSILGVFRKPPA